MSRSFRQAAVCSLAVAATLIAANSSLAGCGGGHYRGGYHNYYARYRAPVVRHVVRPVVHVARPVIAVAPPIAPIGIAPRPIGIVPQLPSVPAGSTLSLPGNFLGPVAGHVFLVLNEVKLAAQIVSWSPNGVTITLPPMAVKRPTPARLDVVLPHGQTISNVKILLTPPAPLVIHPTPPASPLPTGPAAGPLQTAVPQIGNPLVLNPQL